MIFEEFLIRRLNYYGRAIQIGVVCKLNGGWGIGGA